MRRDPAKLGGALMPPRIAKEVNWHEEGPKEGPSEAGRMP